MKIRIPKDVYDDGVNLYTNSDLELETGVTVLCGCNGSGKSTLLAQLKSYCYKNKINFLEFNNLHEGGTHSMGLALQRGNMEFLARQAMSSEGENINNNVAMIFGDLGKKINDSSGKQLFVFFDAVDSGLDIYFMQELSEAFRDFVIPDAKSFNVELYALISTNSYEFCVGNRCLDVRTLKPVEFNSYEEYRDFILESHKKKEKRYDRIMEKAEERRRGRKRFL